MLGSGGVPPQQLTHGMGWGRSSKPRISGSMEAGREPPRAVHHEQNNSAAAWRPTATRLQPLRRPTPTYHDP